MRLEATGYMQLHLLQAIHSQVGDTIVEVLIVIAIMSLVLTGAFMTSSRNLNYVQDSQEHSEALNILEGQVEALRYLSQANPDSVFNHTSAKDFCIYQPDSTAFKRENLTGSDASTMPSLNNDILSTAAYPQDCQNGRYYLSIAYDSSQDDLFTFRARWESIGNGHDQVILNYRIHPEVATAGSAPVSPPAPPGNTPASCPDITFPPSGGIDDINPGDNQPADKHAWDLFVHNPQKATDHPSYTLPASESDGLASIQPSSSVSCKYRVHIETVDNGHPDVNQQHEELCVVFMKGATVLATTEDTRDLPNNQKTITSNLAPITLDATPTSVVFYHYTQPACQGTKSSVGAPNSIQPHQMWLERVP